MIAAEDERDRTGPRLVGDLRRDSLARLLDLGQELRPLVLKRRRLAHRRLDVPVVAHSKPRLVEPLLEARERIAEGPMSTPRRPWPRSSGAPMIATSRSACSRGERYATAAGGHDIAVHWIASAR